MVRSVVALVCLLACELSARAQPPLHEPRRPVNVPQPTDDYELFLENVLNAPRGQRKVWTGKVYNAPLLSPLDKCPGGACPSAPAPRPVLK